MRRIYLDTAAGGNNPASIHAEGVTAKRKLENARKKVAAVLGALPDEIIFTSGGTESNNLAILGVPAGIVLTTEFEHPSVIEAIRARSLYRGRKIILVTVHYANNETGEIQPVREIAKAIKRWRKERGIPRPYFHTDACQAPRFLDLNVQRLGVDMMTLNGNKLGVPGVGLLYVRRGVALKPILRGGGQERGLRSGTENVAAIDNFARALERANRGREKESKRLTTLRDYLIDGLMKLGATLNGPRENRLPNNVNVTFDGIEAEHLVVELDAKGVAVSAGSACANFDPEGSHVKNGVRFSLGPKTNRQDIKYVLSVLPPILARLTVRSGLRRISSWS